MRRRFLWTSVLAALCPAVAHAQIGDGWTPLSLSDDFIDTQSMGAHAKHPLASFTTSGARYERTADSETFELYDPSFNRVEHDTNHHYKTGRIQFEGTVQIYPGVNHQFIIQLFNAPASGPIMALSAYSTNNGTIRKQGGSVDVATNAFGRDIRVNIIHDLDRNTLTVYIDGKSAWSGSGGAGGGFNFKYGSYGSLNGSTSAKARWRNARFWTGGDGGVVPDAGVVVPRDAGVPDAGGDSKSMVPDAAPMPEDPPADAATPSPDVAATGGKSGGTGGAPGTGGKPAPQPDPEEGTGGAGAAPTKAASGGCQVGGPSSGGTLAIVLALVAWHLGRRRGSPVPVRPVGVGVGVSVGDPDGRPRRRPR